MHRDSPSIRASRMGWWIVGGLLVQMIRCPLSEGAIRPPIDRTEHVQVGTLTRLYHLHLPPTDDGMAPLPLVLVFHGTFETARQIAQVTQFNRLADQHRFIVVYPVGLHHRWNDGRGTTSLAPKVVDDIGFVAALIQHVESTLTVDPARIYATGMSNGAMFVQRLACELSETLAAIGPVDGALPLNLVGRCAPAHPVSVIEFHGTKDPYTLWHGGRVRAVGGRTLSVPQTVAYWSAADGCQGPAQVQRLPHHHSLDPTRLRRETFGPCREESEVILYAIEGGGHTWPGGPDNPLFFSGAVNRDLSATETIWAFFEQHPKLPSTRLMIAKPAVDVFRTTADAVDPDDTLSTRPGLPFGPMLDGSVALPFSVLSDFLHLVMTLSVP